MISSPLSNSSYQPNTISEMSGNARVVPVQLIRNKSVDDFNDQVINMLDDVERRVEQLRYLYFYLLLFR